jgi:hypothetical protein
MKFSHRITTAVVALFAAAGSLAAQDATQNSAATDPQVPVAAAPAVEQAPVNAPAPQQPVSLAPLAANATVGIHQLAPSAPVPYTPDNHDHVGRNVAMMIVGGAALVVGAVVGGTPGTIIMVGGGVIGLVGLFRYLQ